MSEEYRKKLEALGSRTVFDSMHASTDELITRIEDADIVIAGRHGFSQRAIEAAKKLKMVSVWQTGYDHVDIEIASKKALSYVMFLIMHMTLLLKWSLL